QGRLPPPPLRGSTMSNLITQKPAEVNRAEQARRALSNYITLSTLGPLIALLIASAFFATQSPRFLTGANLALVVQQVMVVGTLAIGQTLVILTAGIDLSNGAVMAFGTIVMTKFASDYGINPYLSILIGLLVCAGFGYLNGNLITFL